MSVRNGLLAAFFAVFAVFFAAALFLVMFRNPHNMDALPLVLTCVGVACLAVLIWRLPGRVGLSRRTGVLILALFVAVTAALQLYIGYRLRFTPMWDMEGIFNGGVRWAETGALRGASPYHGDFADYFAMFPNQYGGVFIFRCVFGICGLFGFTDYALAALVYNVAMIQVMVFALYCAANRMLGGRGGLFVLALTGLFPPFYAMGGLYYTDALSMPFAAIAFAVYLRARDEKGLKTQLLLFALCGLAAAFGAVIKFTVIIVLVAIAIDYALGEAPAPRRIAGCCAALLAAAAFIAGFTAYMDSRLEPERIDERRIPKTHWVMMGLQGTGSYNPADYDFTMAIPTLKERSVQTAQVAWERAGELGAGGLLSLFADKTAYNFGDGTLGMSMFYDDAPIERTALHEVVLSDGEYFGIYAYASTACLSAALALMLWYAVSRLMRCRNHGFDATVSAVPFLALFGLLLFSLVWETSPKMPFNLFPLIVAGMAAGASDCSRTFGVVPTRE